MKQSFHRSIHTHSRSGFSLVEMIGVLAIIAILAVVIVPKVFSTIASSRITNAVGSVGAMKSAISEFAGKYGTVPTTTANSRIDDLLIAAGMLENRFVTKIGTQPGSALVTGAAWARPAATGVWTATGGSDQSAQTRIICLTSAATAPSTSAGANFRLNGGNVNLPTGSLVVSAVIVNLTGAEARELSLKIDGDALSATSNTAADNNGKVAYAAPVNGLTTAYIYIAHQ